MLAVNENGSPGRSESVALDDRQIERAIAIFREALLRSGRYITLGRETVARAALRCNGRFDVYRLWNNLREAGHFRGGLFAIHRTLPLLVDAGLIREIVGGAYDRRMFELAFERPCHCYLSCLTCGTVIELGSAALQMLQREVAHRFEFELIPHSHELLGKCSKCRSRP
jgi:Fur family ferric uptake transcriptional regulator